MKDSFCAGSSSSATLMASSGVSTSSTTGAVGSYTGRCGKLLFTRETLIIPSAMFLGTIREGVTAHARVCLLPESAPPPAPT